MARILLSVCAALALALASGCDSSGAVGIGGDAGAAGDTGEAGAAGAACDATGEGTVETAATGLPKGVEGKFELVGPDGPVALTSNSQTVPAGAYLLKPLRVYDEDPIVRTAFDSNAKFPPFCLTDGSTFKASTDYAPIATSNELWTANGPGGTQPLLGFASKLLGASGAPDVSVAIEAPVGRSIAFDFDGNAWVAGATVGDPTVLRYGAPDLGATGKALPTKAFNVPAIDCTPAVRGLALDPTGNLWLSTCGNVVRIPTTQLGPSGVDAPDVDVDVTLSGLESNEDVAFDSAGNLWVASADKVVRFDKARLGADDADAPDLTLAITTDDTEPKALAANFLAFDVKGNLWALDFAGNAAFEIAKADLTGSGEKTKVAVVHITVDVEAVMSRPAFDDAGALWLSLAAGKFGKLSPAQLKVSSDAGAPTTPAIVIASPDVGYADGLAFFPAASGLPLVSAQP